jgi:hypothetical protein
MVRIVQPPSNGQSLTRFDRRQTEGNLPAELGSATEQFWNALERQVRGVLEVAEAHAAELEREADRQATKTKQESEAKAQQMLEGTFARASRVLDSIALVENALSGMLDTLRAELADQSPAAASAKPLPGTITTRDDARPGETRRPAEQAASGELQRAPASERRPEENQPATAQPAVTNAQLRERDEDRSVPATPPGPESEVPQLDIKGQFDRLMRAQLSRMVQEGKPREEVKRLLARTRGGERYLGILDQFYAERPADEEPPPQGLLSRLLRRGH